MSPWFGSRLSNLRLFSIRGRATLNKRDPVKPNRPPIKTPRPPSTRPFRLSTFSFLFLAPSVPAASVPFPQFPRFPSSHSKKDDDHPKTRGRRHSLPSDLACLIVARQPFLLDSTSICISRPGRRDSLRPGAGSIFFKPSIENSVGSLHEWSQSSAFCHASDGRSRTSTGGMRPFS